MPQADLTQNFYFPQFLRTIETNVRLFESEYNEVIRIRTITQDHAARMNILYENILNSLRNLSVPNIFETYGYTLLYITLYRVKKVIGQSNNLIGLVNPTQALVFQSFIDRIGLQLDTIKQYYEAHCMGYRAGSFPSFPRIDINSSSDIEPPQNINEYIQNRFCVDINDDFAAIQYFVDLINNGILYFNFDQITYVLSNIIALSKIIDIVSEETIAIRFSEFQVTVIQNCLIAIQNNRNVFPLGVDISQERLLLQRKLFEALNAIIEIKNRIRNYTQNVIVPTITISREQPGQNIIAAQQTATFSRNNTERNIDNLVLHSSIPTTVSTGVSNIMQAPILPSVEPSATPTAELLRRRNLEFNTALNCAISASDRRNTIQTNFESGSTYTLWRMQTTDFASIQSLEDLWNLYQDNYQEMLDDLDTSASNLQIPTFTKRDVAKAYNLLVLYLRKVAEIENTRAQEQFLFETSSEEDLPLTFGKFNRGRFFRFIQNRNAIQRPQNNQYVLEISDEEAERYFGVSRIGGRVQPRHLRNSLKNAIKFIESYFPQNSDILTNDLRVQVAELYDSNLGLTPHQSGNHFGYFCLPIVKTFNRTKKVSFPWMLMLNYKNWASNGVIQSQPILLSEVRNNIIDEEYRRNLLEVMRSSGTPIPEFADGRVFVDSNNIQNYIRNAIRTHESYQTNTMVPLYDADNRLHTMLIKLISLSNRTRERFRSYNSFRSWNDGNFELTEAGIVSEFRISKQTVESILRIGSLGSRGRSSSYPTELIACLDKINVLAATFGCRVSSTTIRATDDNRRFFPVDRSGQRLNEIRTFRVENFPIFSVSTYIEGQSPLIPRDPATIIEVPSFFRLNSIDNLIPTTMYQFLETIVLEEETRNSNIIDSTSEVGVVGTEIPIPPINETGCNCATCRAQRERELQSTQESLEGELPSIEYEAMRQYNVPIPPVSNFATPEQISREANAFHNELELRMVQYRTQREEPFRINSNAQIAMDNVDTRRPVQNTPQLFSDRSNRTPRIQSQFANYLATMFSSNRNQNSVQTEQSNNEVQASPLEE